MNTNELRTGSACKNNLVCHDLGECLRPTPETDEQIGCGYEVDGKVRLVQLVQPDFARRLERERDEARDRIAELKKRLTELQEPKKPKEQDTFESHGLTWIKHTPGDPMPCEAESIVWALTRGAAQNKYRPWTQRACYWDWYNRWKDDCQIIGWNYADAP